MTTNIDPKLVEPALESIRKNLKHNKALLEQVAKASKSVSEMMRNLGLAQAGGTHTHISNMLKRYQIDTSHFLGQAYNRGRIPNNRKTAEQILVLLPEGSHRPKVAQLRRAMVELGVVQECKGCGQEPSWNGSPLVLEVHHKDGNWLNNLIENLEFMCPNCHSQQ